MAYAGIAARTSYHNLNALGGPLVAAEMTLYFDHFGSLVGSSGRYGFGGHAITRLCDRQDTLELKHFSQSIL